jgi:hypothetical protein
VVLDQTFHCSIVSSTWNFVFKQIPVQLKEEMVKVPFFLCQLDWWESAISLDSIMILVLKLFLLTQHNAQDMHKRATPAKERYKEEVSQTQ